MGIAIQAIQLLIFGKITQHLVTRMVTWPLTQVKVLIMVEFQPRIQRVCGEISHGWGRGR